METAEGKVSGWVGSGGRETAREGERCGCLSLSFKVLLKDAQALAAGPESCWSYPPRLSPPNPGQCRGCRGGGEFIWVCVHVST